MVAEELIIQEMEGSVAAEEVRGAQLVAEDIAAAVETNQLVVVQTKTAAAAAAPLTLEQIKAIRLVLDQAVDKLKLHF